jgi:arsenate reductase (thioredoxin)
MQSIQKVFRNGFVAVGIVTMVVSAGAAPVHPERLNEKLRQYVAGRVGEFDSIPAERRDQLRKLASYIRDKVKADRPARLIFICTHNSRRSQMCQLWAASAAAYFGVPHVENFSGGTEVTAFNSRAVAALRRAGFGIDDPATAQNPRYRVRFQDAGPELECFSKVYRDATNPRSDFCAVMTCSQADKQCPIVAAASERIALPFDDPKAFDGTPQETSKYDERCQQIARELLFVFSQVAAPE